MRNIFLACLFGCIISSTKPVKAMDIYLGQMEFSSWADNVMAKGWKGDGWHSYREMKKEEVDAYFKKAREYNQKVVLTLGDRLLGYDPQNPGIYNPTLECVAMGMSALKNKDIFTGWHCEGKWVLDPVVVKKVIEGMGAKNCIVFDNNMIDASGLAKRMSRLWYPNARPENVWPTHEQIKEPGFTKQYFRDHPEVRREMNSLYPLAILLNTRLTRELEISCWIPANGVPADDPFNKIKQGAPSLSWLSHVYVQPRMDQMFYYLLACEYVGCKDAYFYTYSTPLNGWAEMSNVYPRLWKEMNLAIEHYKAKTIPQTWKETYGSYVLQKDWQVERDELDATKTKLSSVREGFKKALKKIAILEPVSSDFDKDGDVDNIDFMVISRCFNGPGKVPNHDPDCPAADLDKDGDVDSSDSFIFSNCFNGPTKTPKCVNLD